MRFLIFIFLLVLFISAYNLTEVIKSATPGSTIYLPMGTYYGPIIIEKPIRLVGPAVIDGNNNTAVIIVRNTKGVKIEGLAIGNTSRVDLATCIYIENSSDVEITNIKLSRCLYPIFISNSRNVVVRNSTIESFADVPVVSKAFIGGGELPLHELTQFFQGHGVYIWYSFNVTVANNIISHTLDGVYCDHSYNITIVNNTFINGNRYAVHLMYCGNGERDIVIENNKFSKYVAGTVIMYSKGVIVRGNVFDNFKEVAGVAVVLFESDYITVINNMITNSYIGFQTFRTPFSDAGFAYVVNNTFAYNFIGIYLDEISRIKFLNNNIFENVEQVFLTSTARAEFKGNYWGGAKFVEIRHTFLDFMLEAVPVVSIIRSSAGFILVRTALSSPLPGAGAIIDESPSPIPYRLGPNSEVKRGDPFILLAITVIVVITAFLIWRRL